jgi:hypothetical protein
MYLYLLFLFVCLFVCCFFSVNKMLFIIQALHCNKRQVHFLSFIDKMMHKSLVTIPHKDHLFKSLPELYEQTSYELDLQHRQSSRRRLHCMRTPLYIFSDTHAYMIMLMVAVRASAKWISLHSQVALFYRLKGSNIRHVRCEIKFLWHNLLSKWYFLRHFSGTGVESHILVISSYHQHDHVCRMGTSLKLIETDKSCLTTVLRWTP